MRPILHRLTRAAQVTAIGSTAGLGSFFFYTRKNELIPIDASDRIFDIVRENHWNPHCNPVTQDYFIRRVPLAQIRPELQDNPDKIADAFCAGIFGNWGFFIQRTLLNAYARNASNDDHLWTREDLYSSNYEPGTLIMDSFEVLERKNNGILVRGGDSPSKGGPRPLDAVLEIKAALEEEDPVVEFGFKSIFYAGDKIKDRPPMPGPVVWLHLQYAKLLLESGVSNTTV